LRPALLLEALRSALRRAHTLDYPRSKRGLEVPPDYRGLHYPDFSKCTGCSLCAIDCPASAIKMEKLGIASKANPRGLYPVVDYWKCVFCYHCVYVCPVKAYVTTPEFELAKLESRDSLVFSEKTLGGGES